MVFIIFNRTSDPEDGENNIYIENIFDDKNEAFSIFYILLYNNKGIILI